MGSTPRARRSSLPTGAGVAAEIFGIAIRDLVHTGDKLVVDLRPADACTIPLTSVHTKSLRQRLLVKADDKEARAEACVALLARSRIEHQSSGLVVRAPNVDADTDDAERSREAFCPMQEAEADNRRVSKTISSRRHEKQWPQCWHSASAEQRLSDILR